MAKRKTAATPAQPKHTIQYLSIDSVFPSELNPRKKHDDEATKELAESIKAIGLIQPVTVRPDAKPGIYKIVCGERRYFASRIAGLDELPAVVRTLSDSEALELMITENLQRKDVHPLEESDAIKLMMDKMGMSLEDIAAKMGKPLPSIKQRLSMQNLIPELREKFDQQELPIGHCVFLSQYHQAEQKAWLDERFGAYWKPGAGTFKDLKSFFSNRVNGKLENAIFDITAENVGTINKCACTVCPHNTAVSNLFGDFNGKGECTYRACFNDKTFQEKKKKLDAVLQDKEVFLISSSHNSDTATAIKKDGHHVLERWNEFKQVETPELYEVEREEFEDEDGFDQESFDSAVAAAKDEFEKEKIEFESRKDSLKKAYDVDTGEMVFIELRAAGVNSVAGDEASPEAVKNQALIAGLKQKLTSGRELDREKVMKQALDLLKEDPSFTDVPEVGTEPSETEMECLFALALQHSGYSNKAADILMLNSKYLHGNGPQFFEALGDAQPHVLTFIIRQALLHQFSGIAPNSLNGPVINSLAKNHNSKAYEDILQKQIDICERRENKLNLQIKELENPPVEAS